MIEQNEKIKHIRDSRFELLRIVSMLMIICYHFVVHGCEAYLSVCDFSNRILLDCLSMYGKVGVNIFVLVTGYFGISLTFEKRKFVRYISQVSFISILLMLVAVGFWGGISRAMILKSFLPLIFNMYWFATAYAVLFVFANYINKMLLSLKRDEHIKLIVIICVLWSIIPTLTFQVKDGLNWTQQIWVFAMYIFGASIRLLRIEIKGKILLILMILFNVALIVSPVVLQFIGLRFSIASIHATYFRWSNTILALPVSVLLFMAIMQVKTFTSKIVNNIASCTMAVYLFHENPIISKYLWELLGCNSVIMINTLQIMVKLVICVLIFFIVGFILNCIFIKIYNLIIVVINFICVNTKKGI